MRDSVRDRVRDAIIASGIFIALIIISSIAELIAKYSSFFLHLAISILVSSFFWYLIYLCVRYYRNQKQSTQERAESQQRAEAQLAQYIQEKKQSEAASPNTADQVPGN